MNRLKDESNGVIEKETLTPKIAKKPIDKLYERKQSNPNFSQNQESIKSPIPDSRENTESKNLKIKLSNGNYAFKSENIDPILNEKDKNMKIVKNIGFENLPNQIYRRSLFNGFEFNLMVVGCSGLGKSTFVNSLFLSELYSKENLAPSKRIHKTVHINASTVNLSENAVNLRLTLIDTPGFGDSVDNSDCWRPVVEYIEQRYNEYMLTQNHINRARVHDGRVHVCLYFIEPTGHGLKALDLEFMKQIHTKVNVVPIIAKADCLVPDECADFKKTVLGQLRTAGIKTYDFPEESAIISLGGSVNKSNETNLRDIVLKRRRQPFGVVSSNILIDKAGTKVRGRVYPWGTVEVDNLEHNDFSALRTLLLSSHLQDLKDHTDQVLYENFRFTRLTNIAKDSQFGITADGKDPMSQMDEEKRQFEHKISKMEFDMEQLFDKTVQSKTRKLEELQKLIERTQWDMKNQLDQETSELEYRRKRFESDRLQWEETCRNYSFMASMDNLDQVKEKSSKSKSKWTLK